METLCEKEVVPIVVSEDDTQVDECECHKLCERPVEEQTSFLDVIREENSYDNLVKKQDCNLGLDPEIYPNVSVNQFLNFIKQMEDTGYVVFIRQGRLKMEKIASMKDVYYIYYDCTCNCEICTLYHPIVHYFRKTIV